MHNLRLQMAFSLYVHVSMFPFYKDTNHIELIMTQVSL